VEGATPTRSDARTGARFRRHDVQERFALTGEPPRANSGDFLRAALDRIAGSGASIGVGDCSRGRAQSVERIETMTRDVASTGVAAEELKQLVERIEKLEEEKAAIAGDIKDVFAEAKGRGFDVKAIRHIIRLRKKDHAERQEEEAILELYMEALGM
jgi:uncharacterized protein (UPF0335 family)